MRRVAELESFDLLKQMSFLTGLAFVAGIIIGMAFCLLVTKRERRNFTQQMILSNDIQANFYATTAMCYLDAQKKLEAGDTTASKQDLAFGAANFCHHFAGSGEPTDRIQAQVHEIRDHAERSEILRSALDQITAKERVEPDV